ncbi:hypothetical protein BN975_00988 [Mycolicibacterium farcinogenes]|uniref:Uncharacterized protein n=2 Tax=Mycobacteriaceae TaxID=1762 RepID=A0A378T6S1_9MYCO|nr:hypothetical protein BN975_00988 [Mycolicibacterium farcinogenes]STZ55206.1 Uncharacterised protein [Mycolicibacterium senegalense]
MTVRRTVRVGRAGAAGVLIALGIGLGAYNSWWIALLLSLPLIVGGVALLPWPSRVSELVPFVEQTLGELVPVRVDALSRSSLAENDLQPTLVTATISPPHDTAYQGRWIASMSSGEFRSLTERPDTELPLRRLPPREPARAPEFHDQPGKWAVIYPAVTMLVALTVLFGVGDAWHISPSSASAPAAPRADTGPKSKSMDLNARRDGMIRAITAQFGPAAANNLLGVRLTGSGSDYGTVLDPTNGDTTTVYINNGGDAFTTPSPRVQRKDSTFLATDIASTDLNAIVDKMVRQLESQGRLSKLDTLEIKRSGPGAPVILTGTFGSKTVDALPDGTVGEIFDPADFAVSFQKARDGLALAGIAPSDRVLTNFEIRGTHRATPTARPSEVQTNGGVMLDFQTGDRAGQIIVVPGELPEITDKSYNSGRQTFSFDDISQEAFETVRAQAMQRGALEPYEREAVDIWLTDREIDEHRLAIRIELAGVKEATGTYSLTGEFLAPGAI